MGMFDYVKCDYPLPDGYVPPGTSVDFQTKTRPDSKRFMEPFIITFEGRLLLEEGDYETVPEKERPQYVGDGGLHDFIGSMQKVNKVTRDVHYHGDFEFHTYDQEAKEMRQYVARFTHGQLEWIKGGLGAARRTGDMTT